MNAPKSVEALSGPVSGMDTRPSNANPAATGPQPRIATEAEPSGHADHRSAALSALRKITRIIHNGDHEASRLCDIYDAAIIGLGAATASPESLGVSQDEPSPTHAEATATEAQHAGQATSRASVASIARYWAEAPELADIITSPGQEHSVADLRFCLQRAAELLTDSVAAPPSPAPPSSEREGSRAGDRS